MTVELKHIFIEALKRGEYQPRRTFNPDALKELADSIKSQGLIEPLIVREHSPNEYEIIAGERRWRAAMIAGLSEVPCLVGNYSNEQAAAVTLIENIQRQDLNLLEEASGFQRLIEEFHFHQHEVATLVGKSRSHVANTLRLLTLCPQVQALILSQTLSQGHARLLVGLPAAQQVKLATKVQALSWSVRRLEKEVHDLKNNGVRPQEKQSNQDIIRLENHLSDHLGTPVAIINDVDKGGWLKIKFYDNDTLSGLLDKLGVDCE